VSGDPLAPHTATPVELQERLAAQRRGAPFLVHRDAGGRQVVTELGDRARVSIGRSPGNDVALRWDAEVSRVHAALERVGDDWLVSDDRLSHNGTFVNGDRVHGRRRLRSGDVVTAGATQIVFLAPAAGSVSATRTTGRPLVTVDVTPAQRRVLVALCRPVLRGAAPASNRAIAGELVLALDTVKGTLSRLFEAFGIGGDVPQNQKRAALAQRALQLGIVRHDELHQ
jgi:pSer/pThr/pTyr-binding forkhead associated (FHA) protein